MVFQECSDGGGARSGCDSASFDVLGLMKQGRQLTNAMDDLKEAVARELAKALVMEMILLQPTVPDDIKPVLDDLGVQSINISGKEVSIRLDRSKYKNYDGCPPLWFDKNIKGTVERNGDTISIKDMSGVMVDPGNYLPWAHIKSATFEKRDGKCIAKVTGGRFGVNHTQTIELDGEVYDRLNKILKANGL